MKQAEPTPLLQQQQQHYPQQEQQQQVFDTLPSKAHTISDGPAILDANQPPSQQHPPSSQSNRVSSATAKSADLTPTNELTTTTTTTTTTTSTPSAATSRKSSLAGSVLATAASAATAAIDAARNLVSKDILEEEAKQDLTINEDNHSSLFSSLSLNNETSHHGLEFQQRKLTSGAKLKPTTTTTTTTTTAPAPNTAASSSAAVQSDVVSNSVPTNQSSIPTTIKTNTTADLTPHNNNNNTNIPAIDNKNTITFADTLPPRNSPVYKNTGNNTIANSNVPTNVNTNPNSTTIPNANGSVQQPNPSTTTILQGNNNSNNNNNNNGITDNNTNSLHNMPGNTIYVAAHGPQSARHGGLGVDKPAISHAYPDHQQGDLSSSTSGLGVDKPRLVGTPHDPNEHRKGALQVDTKHPADNHHEIHVPHDNFTTATNTSTPISTATTVPASGVGVGGVGATNVNAAPARLASSTGLNVDIASKPSKKMAGSGASEDTHKVGSYNSGFNVDKTTSKDQKRSGLGVDGPSLYNHHMVSAHDPHLGTDSPRTVYSGDNNAEAEKRPAQVSAGMGNPSATMNSNSKNNNITSASASASTSTSTTTNTTTNAIPNQILLGTAGTGMASSSKTISVNNNINAGGHLITDAPLDYHGPLPQVAPGEEIMWVKRVIRTDYYDDGGLAGAPIPEPDINIHQEPRRSSVGSFIDRLRGRDHDQRRPSVDKGKQRS
ncbi:hypothetical protein BGZ94_009485 [Podila epigama]|nr:hypothetical protein BGZ94_009485 [Podila epigama]